LRARIAERMLEAQRSAAILTTFNEVNMQALMDLRHNYREVFQAQHGVKLGIMGFFVKACTEALRRYPVLNASVDGDDIVYHGYFDVGVAVSTSRGLVVPVLRNADKMGLAEIEGAIAGFGSRGEEGKLGIDELTGGTFTISNGGVFGSMLSTPILNPPQSAILGLHRVQPRPIAEGDKVVVRPMMYLALSYDHRIIDGRDAVLFLVAVKELIEDPTRFILKV
jgi:2-oxoglutarate dehydrogenase E2 component (dihydrolipoamide succinyltransferase)